MDNGQPLEESPSVTGNSLETAQETDKDGSSATSTSPSNLLLSTKAQQTLRKIHSLRKVLMDNSLRAEIEAALGSDDIGPITQEGLVTAGAELSLQNEATTKTQHDAIKDVAMQTDENESKDPDASKDMGINATDISKKQSSANRKTDFSPSSPNSSAHVSKKKQSNLEEVQPPLTRNVTFAASMRSTTNSNNLRTGNLQDETKATPNNPYTTNKSKHIDQSTLYAHPASLSIAKTDKVIILKKNMTRLHIHRYTLRFETIKEKNEEEGQQLVKDTFQ